MSIRTLADRFRHVKRRDAARRFIETEVRPGRVLVLCHGNICRSPFAEALFAASLPASIAGAFPVHSAGFIGPNRQSPPQAMGAAARRGVDLSPHRSKLVTGDMVRESALVVVMSAEQANGIRSRFGDSNPRILILGDLDPLPVETRTIKDPWSCDDSVFDDSYARIDRCVRELIRLLSPGASSAPAET